MGGLLVSLGLLAFRAGRRRGYGPFWTGMAAAICIVTAKFLFVSSLLLYGGVVILIAASLWNSWPMQESTGRQSAVLSQPEERS